MPEATKTEKSVEKAEETKFVEIEVEIVSDKQKSEPTLPVFVAPTDPFPDLVHVHIEAVAIPCGYGAFLMLDKEDLPKIAHLSLLARYSGRPQRLYVFGNPIKSYKLAFPDTWKLLQNVPVHRLISEAPKGKHLFFVNGFSLDCRKANLTFDQEKCWFKKGSLRESKMETARDEGKLST